MLTLTILIIATLPYFKPSHIVHKDDNEYMKRMFATERIGQNADEVSEEHKNWSEDYLLLPNWSEKAPDELPNQIAEFISGDGDLEIEKISEVEYRIKAKLNSPSDINLNMLYFPGWFVYVNDKNFNTKPNRPIGSIKIVDVPRGEHDIRLVWKETRLRLVFDLLSVLSFVAVLFLFLKGNKAEKSKTLAAK